MLNQPLKAIKLKRTTFRAITGETKRNKDKKLKRTEQVLCKEKHTYDTNSK